MDKYSPDSNRNRFSINPPNTAKRQQDWGSLAKLIGKQPLAADGHPGDHSSFIADPSVTTDQRDYRPGETALITASGFRPGSTIAFAIADDPKDPGEDGDADIYAPFSVTDGVAGDLDGKVNGTVVTRWRIPTDNNASGSGTPDALNATLQLTATGTDGKVATTTFADAASIILTGASVTHDETAGLQNSFLSPPSSQKMPMTTTHPCRCRQLSAPGSQN